MTNRKRWKRHIGFARTCMLLALLFILIIPVVTFQVQGLSGDSWTNFGGNEKHNGLSSDRTNNTTSQNQWTFGAPSNGIFTGLWISNDGTVYSIENQGNSLFLYAITESGSLKWVSNMSGVWSSSTPYIAIGSDGTIYTSTIHGIRAINPVDGSIKWENKLDNESTYWDVDPGLSPDGQILVANNNRLVSLDANGSVVWELPIAGIYSGIAIDSKGMIYAKSDNGWLYSIYPNGMVYWNASIPNGTLDSFPPVIRNDGIILSYGNRGISAFDRNGSVLWTYVSKYPQVEMKDVISGPIVVDAEGNSYLRYENTTVGNDGNYVFRYYLLSLDAQGNIRWSLDKDIRLRAVSADGILYGTTDDQFVALRTDGSIYWEKRALSSPSPLDEPASASDCVAIGSNGTVYFIGHISTSLEGHSYIIAFRGLPVTDDSGSSLQLMIPGISAGAIIIVLLLCYVVKRRDKGEGA